jgi:hypothetical protein
MQQQHRAEVIGRLTDIDHSIYASDLFPDPIECKVCRGTLAAGEHRLLAQKSTPEWRVKQPSTRMKAPKAKTNIRQNGEKNSLFRSTVPPTFEFIAAKTDAEGQ